MVEVKWAYLAEHGDNPPVIELNCSELELAEAKKELNPNQFTSWVSEVSSGVSHTEAMAWARS